MDPDPGEPIQCGSRIQNTNFTGPDPGSDVFFDQRIWDPGSFGLKILKFFDVDPDPGSGII
jgi:hypothetical protein